MTKDDLLRRALDVGFEYHNGRHADTCEACRLYLDIEQALKIPDEPGADGAVNICQGCRQPMSACICASLLNRQAEPSCDCRSPGEMYDRDCPVHGQPEAASVWIDVKEREPKAFERVMMCWDYDEKKPPQLGHVFDDGHRHHWVDFAGYVATPTHWQPVPALPLNRPAEQE